MATYTTPEPFLKKVETLMESIAEYAYNEGYCGYTAACEFQTALDNKCKATAEAPLQNSSEWGNPTRRTFFECKGQYTLIFVFAPTTAKTNPEVEKIIFSDIYPSASIKGNTPRPDEKIFDIDDLFKE
ncbi:MAG: hypothetical protein QF441_08925 [Bacteriovoracaceae bacterium]|nr:hypothetical protein [Bacteriovoracaceae bacterium]